MRKIRFISFICVLALILSLCSVFSFAAAPEAGNGREESYEKNG